jgi:hypothetical protein
MRKDNAERISIDIQDSTHLLCDDWPSRETLVLLFTDQSQGIELALIRGVSAHDEVHGS